MKLYFPETDSELERSVDAARPGRFHRAWSLQFDHSHQHYQWGTKRDQVALSFIDSLSVSDDQQWISLLVCNFIQWVVFSEWVNVSGQLSWLKQIAHHPDVFCLGDYEHSPVNLTCLKVQPDETNKDVCNWLVGCIYLVFPVCFINCKVNKIDSLCSRGTGSSWTCMFKLLKVTYIFIS